MVALLPQKEANLFKLIVKSYETKQYKKGLKASDQILKKFPDHGETLAMKGLTLNCMDRKAEAYDLVRKGLKNDVKSYVCWHVYGLLYRSDREYREAIKCYRNALRIDPENIQILRDLSLLQAQMRDRSGFVETRRQLLGLKPGHRNNWIAFAIAQHLNGSPGTAVQIMEAYEGTLDEGSPPDSERYEHSEMLLYKTLLLEESGALEAAIKELEDKEKKIVDKVSLREQRAKILLELGRLEEAEKCYRSLLDLNPDNYRYYEGLQACLGLSLVDANGGSQDPERTDRLMALFAQLREQYPRSAAAKRIPLDFLSGEAFGKAVEEYAQPFLSKGVPSLFRDLRPLYSQPGKADLMDAVFKKLEDSLRKTQAFPPSQSSEGEPTKEPPSTILWMLFLLAQHYDRRRQFDLALEKIDEAIAHTPTVIDLYLIKGRILKHVGNLMAAAAWADEARSMDLADRYLNGEAVKRMLKADQMELAEQTAALFTKDGEQHNNLFDMQGMWYELRSGESYMRQGRLGKALKMYLWTHKHYNDMLEDQFDFHTYCLRKMTLRAYVRMLSFEDKLHNHQFFCRGAQGAIRAYLALFDRPRKATAEEEEAALAGMSATERKKMRAKQRKVEAKIKKEKEDKVRDDATQAKDKSGKRKPDASVTADPDPDGEKLTEVEDVMGEAVKYLRLLQDHASGSMETHLLAFEVHFRRKKLLLALQAVKRMMKLDPEHPDLHRCFVRFFHLVDSLPQEGEGAAPALVREVIGTEGESLRGEKSLVACNDEFLARHQDSLPHRVASAEMMALLSSSDRARAVEVIDASVPSCAKSGGCMAEGVPTWTLPDCVRVHGLLENVLEDEAAAARWKEKCSKIFPYSTYFEGSKVAQYTKHLGSNRSPDGGEVVEDVAKTVSKTANGVATEAARR